MDAKNEINDVRPSSLNHLIGQKSVVEQVRVALEASFADHAPFPSSILVGPPGTGKTAVASTIAAELAVDYQEVLGQSVSDSSELNALLLAATPNSVVFIDEAHELPKREIQTALYLALDQKKILISGRSGPLPIPLNDFSLLLATTDEYDILQPLRDRMKLILRFEYYSYPELTRLIDQRAKALGWPIDDELPFLIGGKAKGTPRLALRLLQSCRRVCRAEGDETITKKHLERTLELEGIDALGLCATEQKYLSQLVDGPGRLNVLASVLGLPTRTVSSVIEPFLLRAGLVAKDDKGRRQLTLKGREHLSKSSGTVG